MSNDFPITIHHNCATSRNVVAMLAARPERCFRRQAHDGGDEGRRRSPFALAGGGADEDQAKGVFGDARETHLLGGNGEAAAERLEVGFGQRPAGERLGRGAGFEVDADRAGRQGDRRPRFAVRRAAGGGDEGAQPLQAGRAARVAGEADGAGVHGVGATDQRPQHPPAKQAPAPAVALGQGGVGEVGGLGRRQGPARRVGVAGDPDGKV